MNIGQFNTLKVTRKSDYGLYLSDDNSLEVLLPNRYITPDITLDSELRVFVYRDSEDRPVATTETPKAVVGEFAQLKVTSVNSIGAFADWGLSKELLIPFSEQKVRMEPGRWYIVYVYLDDNTGRIVASAKLEKFLNNVIPHYRTGDVVDILIWQRTDLGFKAIVNNLHSGMLYFNELPHEINVGEHYKAKVKKVRHDGKIDLTLGGHVIDRTAEVGEKIIAALADNHGTLDIGDSSLPHDIRLAFGCSKKDFKKALGLLYKQKKIIIENFHIKST